MGPSHPPRPARRHRCRGDLDAASGYADAGLEEAATTGARFYEPVLHRRRAELLVTTSVPDEADEELRQAYGLVRAGGAKAFGART
jgi:hypothetical protein